MPEPVNISIPFRAIPSSTASSLFVWDFEDHRLQRAAGGCYGTSTPPRAKLRKAAAAAVDDALTAAANNYPLAVVACNDGAVFVVRHLYGSWQYDILEAGRRRGASCSGSPTFAEACRRAIEHAASGFGGVAWSSGIHPLAKED